MKHAYIGDGLYASDDGFMLTLRTERTNGEHWVGLEPEVLESLFRFVERTRGLRITVERCEPKPVRDNGENGDFA